MHFFICTTTLISACFSAVVAISLDLNSTDSIKDAARTAANDLTSFYTGDQPGGTPGLLPGPYYWWEAGAMFGSLIEYWHATNDSQYNPMITQAMIHQASPGYNFMPPNQTKSEGNDDQVFWAFSAMSAAEYNFPPPHYPTPSWVAMAQAVWNTQQARWDTNTCGGGLRWQIYMYNNGFNYKNTPTNAGFMDLGARLYAYTHNSTYRDWVQTSWHWMETIGLISDVFQVYDGSDALKNCSDINHQLWSYNAGMVLHTAAVMYNHTENETWRHRLNGVWNAIAATFFDKETLVMTEVCENTSKSGNCNTDQLSFKAYLARFIAASVKLAPWLYDHAETYLAASAKAAAAQCTGGASGTVCGTKWTTNGINDGTTGVGQQMCALEILTANLIQDTAPPVSRGHGGTSVPNATLGTGGDARADDLPALTQGDRVGAGCLTGALITTFLFGGWCVWFRRTGLIVGATAKHVEQVARFLNNVNFAYPIDQMIRRFEGFIRFLRREKRDERRLVYRSVVLLALFYLCLGPEGWEKLMEKMTKQKKTVVQQGYG